jgi:putative DNA primase/helicase
MAVSSDREEMRKAVAAALREGHSVVNLDNVEHPLASPDLSRALTQPEYADRLLGETRILRLPTNLLWTVTGNNLAFRGDLAVRALVCRLDARLERPEERKFKISNLKAHIAEHRRELVAAALTILRAYVVAGRPNQGLSAWGGFEDWSATIREPLVWLGAADPCVTRQHVIEDDPDREQAAAVLSQWHAAFGDEAIQIAGLLERATSSRELTAALFAVAASKNESNKIDPRRVAWWCREWRDRVVGGLRLERGRNYGDRATWKVSNTVTAVNAVRNPSTNPHEAAGQSTSEFYRAEDNRTDRINRKSGQDETERATLFDSGVLEI